MKFYITLKLRRLYEIIINLIKYKTHILIILVH
jgi:hypothetical protein